MCVITERRSLIVRYRRTYVLNTFLISIIIILLDPFLLWQQNSGLENALEKNYWCIWQSVTYIWNSYLERKFFYISQNKLWNCETLRLRDFRFLNYVPKCNFYVTEKFCDTFWSHYNLDLSSYGQLLSLFLHINE